MRVLTPLTLLALILACPSCRAGSQVGMKADQRNQDLRVNYRNDRWQLTYSMDSRAPEDQRLEARLSWRKGGGSRWHSIGGAEIHPAPHARKSLPLPPEVKADDIVEMVMVCRDEQGRETFLRRIWLVVPPEEYRWVVKPVVGGY